MEMAAEVDPRRPSQLAVRRSNFIGPHAPQSSIPGVPLIAGCSCARCWVTSLSDVTATSFTVPHETEQLRSWQVVETLRGRAMALRTGCDAPPYTNTGAYSSRSAQTNWSVRSRKYKFLALSHPSSLECLAL